jgi:hypothetical protein
MSKKYLKFNGKSDYISIYDKDLKFFNLKDSFTIELKIYSLNGGTALLGNKFQ